jgi:hypothetical protein
MMVSARKIKRRAGQRPAVAWSWMPDSRLMELLQPMAFALSGMAGRPLYYALDGKSIVPTDETGYLTWLMAGKEARMIAETFIGDVRISTVFLGMDHAWLGGPPVLFESMIFAHGDPRYGFVDGNHARYCTWDEAIAGHEEFTERVKRITALKE